jgi:hypothetical protein
MGNTASKKFDLLHQKLITCEAKEWHELNFLQRKGAAVVRQGISVAEFINDENKLPVFTPVPFIGAGVGAICGAIAAGYAILNGSNAGVVLKATEVAIGSIAAFAGSAVAGWIAGGLLGFGLDMIARVGTTAYIAGGLAVWAVGDWVAGATRPSKDHHPRN